MRETVKLLGQALGMAEEDRGIEDEESRREERGGQHSGAEGRDGMFFLEEERRDVEMVTASS